MATTKNWTTIAESSFPWERDALDFVRAQFPVHEPYRAWCNFEFIADDGSVNEVDLLVFTPQGFFLIEITSRPGRLRGDAGTWTWGTDGELTTVDRPYQLANSKAKSLRSLLQRQKACKGKGQGRFVEALVLCMRMGDYFDSKALSLKKPANSAKPSPKSKPGPRRPVPAVEDAENLNRGSTMYIDKLNLTNVRTFVSNELRLLHPDSTFRSPE